MVSMGSVKVSTGRSVGGSVGYSTGGSTLLCGVWSGYSREIKQLGLYFLSYFVMFQKDVNTAVIHKYIKRFQNVVLS